MPNLGRVQSIWRYPVKSLRGERCETLDFGTIGARGDRTYAICDAEGKFGSGKNTRRMRKIDGLLALEATITDDIVMIRFPDGRTMAANDPEISQVLSSHLGLPVTLADLSGMPVFDVASVHLLTTTALNWLKTALPESAIDERRFRPNLLLETPDDAPLEHTWVGHTIRIGNEMTLRVIDRTERCGMIAMAQSELPDDPRVLRHVTQHADLLFGVYAEVASIGRICCGDIVTLIN